MVGVTKFVTPMCLLHTYRSSNKKCGNRMKSVKTIGRDRIYKILKKNEISVITMFSLPIV